MSLGERAPKRPPPGERPVALHLAHISKTFPGTKALDDVGFDVEQGTVHALLGGNGCGKSTLIKILAGVYQADSGGEITIGERTLPASATTPAAAKELGLRFVHQNPAVFPDLTVAENLSIGTEFPTIAGKVRWSVVYRQASSLLARYNVHARPDELARDLRPADRAMLAIARALQDTEGLDDAILVLDEPTASLPEEEVRVLLDSIALCRGAGQTIVYVTHRLDEVLQIADRYTMLRDGHHVVTESAEGLTEDKLVSLIVGRALGAATPASARVDEDIAALEVRHLSGGPLRDVSFRLGRKEVLGIAGLLGSGRTELLRMIFGAYPRASGEILLGAKPVHFHHPADAMARGVAYVPEDRLKDAAFLDLDVRENLSAATLKQFFNGMFIKKRRERLAAIDAITRFRVKTPGEAAVMSTLSGGNQQKVIVGRWLAERPTILLLDEPTHGVDVGARADTYEFIRQVVEEGTSVLLVSSEFEELARVSDRVIGLAHGCIVGELVGSAITAQGCTELAYSTQEISA